MGELNSGPGPGITLLIAIVLVLSSNVLSAPLYEEDDTQDSNSQGVIESQGCYYNFQHYNEGERILTNEPCLNCTCRNRMLMCYLRVCPFTKGIGQNCTVEKVPGQCCPIITCPEVPVQLLTSSTTEHSEDGGRRPEVHHGIKGTAVGHLDNNGCQIDGIFYPNGAQVPGNPEKPCELCYCIRNKTACIMQECALHVDGCRPVYEDGQCFPVRYQCDDQPYEEEPTTTIRPAPTPGLIITTTSSEPLECFYNNDIYEDGSRIQTEDPCEHCYCLKGKIACAVQECGAPLEKEGQNCTALPPAPGKCCPDSYQCDITMSSQKIGQDSEETTEAGFSSVEDAGHPTDGHYPGGDYGATRTTEKPKYGTNQFNEQNADVTEKLTPDAVTTSKGITQTDKKTTPGTYGHKTSDVQGSHLDKEQPEFQDSVTSSNLEHQEELDKGTHLPSKHQDSLPNENDVQHPEKPSSSGEHKITSDDKTKPGITKLPVHDTKPDKKPTNSDFPTVPGSLNDFIQNQNQSQSEPVSSVHHLGQKEKPSAGKPEEHDDKNVPVSESKPDGTKVQDGMQTTQSSQSYTTESEHILHVMEQKKPAPGIESHIQDISSTMSPLDERLSTSNAEIHATEKAGSSKKPSYSGQWTPQPGIYQPDLQGSSFDGYSTPIPAIDEDQNVKGQMTASNTKDQLLDKLHNIIQDVQAQVNDGKTTEMPEEADYKTTTQSPKGHFTEKPDTLPHIQHGSQEGHPLITGQPHVETTKPNTDRETQQTVDNAQSPSKDDIFNKIQGIIHGMFSQVTEAIQTTLAPQTLETATATGHKEPGKTDGESSPAASQNKPDDTEGQKQTGHYPQEVTKYPDETTTRRHASGQTRHPGGSKPEDSEYSTITQYPDYVGPSGEPDDHDKYPEGSKPGDRPYGSSKYPEGAKPTDSVKYPHDTEHLKESVTFKPTGKPLKESKPHDSDKYPYGTESTDENGLTAKPEESGKYPDREKPADKIHGTKYSEKTTDKYPQDYKPIGHHEGQVKFPEGGKPTYSEDTYPTEYPDRETTGTYEHNTHPEGYQPVGGKPQENEKYPHGTEFPEQQGGSTVRPHRPAQYPGSHKPADKPQDVSGKYPEGFTGKPTGSEDLPYGTEYPEGTGVTGRPQDHSKYPIRTKPQKHPYGTEYPDEVGSTITPDEFGKYPEGTSPVKRPEGVHYPSHTGSTGRPHYSTKYPEGFTGKPIGSEDLPYGTEYPEGTGITGTPQDHSEYPEGSKPIRGPEGVHYPSHTGSTGRPHYSTKHPDGKYPEGFTGKPTGSEDLPYGTDYPEGTGVTGRPQDHSKYPIRTKPQKHPYGTEYPDEIGSTITPDEFGKYPEGTSPVKRPEGVHYPSHTGSTVRPHYSTKFPGSKYPEGFTGKPTDLEEVPYGTEYPEGTGVAGRPQDHSEYPEGSKPLRGPEGVHYPTQTGSTGRPHYSTKHPGDKYPEGHTGQPTDSGSTEYPEIETGSPFDQTKYPDGTKPIRGQEGVKYPSHFTSTSKPEIGSHSSEGTKPTQFEEQPYDSSKYPVGFKPNEKYPIDTQPMGTELPEHSTEYPKESGSEVTSVDLGKYPEESKPTSTNYPQYTDATGRPQGSVQYPGKPSGKPSQPEEYPFVTEYPEGQVLTGGPHDVGFGSTLRPDGASKHPGPLEYPESADFTGKPVASDKLPEGAGAAGPEYRPEGTMLPVGSPFDSTRFPVGSRPTPRPIESGKYPDALTQHSGEDGSGLTSKPQTTGTYPAEFEPTYSGKHPQIGGDPNEKATESSVGTHQPDEISKHPEGFRPSGKPHDAIKHPQESKPSEKYPFGTEYPEKVESTTKPSEFEKYPEGTSPVKGSEDVNYPAQTGPTERPHYPSKSTGSYKPSKPEGLNEFLESATGKPTDTEDQSLVTDYPELGATGRPQGSEEYPEQQTETLKPFYPNKYPEGFKPVSTPGESGKYPDGDKLASGQMPEKDKPTESEKHPVIPDEGFGTHQPYEPNKYPEGFRPNDKYPDNLKPTGPKGSTTSSSGLNTHSGEDTSVETVTDYNHEVGSSSLYPRDKVTTEKTDVTKYPENYKPTDGSKDSNKHPEDSEPTKLDDQRPVMMVPNNEKASSQGGEFDDHTIAMKPEHSQKYPDKEGTKEPHEPSKYPGGVKPIDSEKYPFSTHYPDEVGSTVTPDEFGKYPDGTSPVKRPEGVHYPSHTGSTGKPHYSTKYPGGKYPEGFTGKPTDTEEVPFGTEYPEGTGVTGRPQDHSEHPEESKPIRGPEGVHYPTQTGSTGRPHYSTKYPEGFTGKPTGSEDLPYGTDYPEGTGVTGRPQDHSEYPEGSKPIRGPEGVLYPSHTGSTGRPHYSTKYPGDKYPEGFTGKPTDTEEMPYGTEYPEGTGVTGRPQDHSEHPEGTKPIRGPEGVNYVGQSESTVSPHYSGVSQESSELFEGVTGVTKKPTDSEKTHSPGYTEDTKPTYTGEHHESTEQPEGVTGTHDLSDLSKYPEGPKPGVKYPSQAGSTAAPHYSTKYPGSFGSSSRPDDINKVNNGVKPTDSDHILYGTDHPQDFGVSQRPEDSIKYPAGSRPNNKYPAESQTGSYDEIHTTGYPGGITETSKPHDSSKYPEEPQPEQGGHYGTERPDEEGSTAKPYDLSAYPEKSKPFSHIPKLPDEVTESSNLTKHPEGLKPTKQTQDSSQGTGNTIYPEVTKTTLKPQVSSMYPENTKHGSKPEDLNKIPGGIKPSEKVPDKESGQLSPEYSNDLFGTEKPDESTEYSTGFKPHYTTKFPEEMLTDLESMTHGTGHPKDSTLKPHEFGKHPQETNQVKYPGQTESTGRPHYSTKYPDGKYPEGFTGKPTGSEDLPYGTEYPEGTGITGRPQDHSKYPIRTKPQKHPYGTEYPDEVGSTITPDEFGKYPEGTSPVKRPEGVHHPSHTGSTGRPHYSTKYPEGFTGKPIGSEDLPYGTEYPEGTGVTGRPQDHSEHPEGSKPIRGPEGVHYPSHTGSTGRPHYSTKYPGDKYPEGFTGKPIDLEEVPYGTEYPEGTGVTGRPQDHSVKPTHSGELPYSTEYPEIETGSPFDPTKYPDGTKPIRGPEGVKYPSLTGSSERPHYSTNHPGNENPTGVGEPNDLLHQSQGTDDNKEAQVTKIPENAEEYPEGLKPFDKPDESDKYPQGIKPTEIYSHGSDFNRVTDIPFDTNKFPDGVRPTESGEYAPTSKRPDGTLGTTKSHDSGKYPEGLHPSTSGYEPVDGKYPGFTKVTAQPFETSKHPEGSSISDKPYDSNSYPEKRKPILPQHIDASGENDKNIESLQPGVTEKLPDKLRPIGSGQPSDIAQSADKTNSTEEPYGSKHPQEAETTSSGYPDEMDSSKYPDRLKPTDRPHGSNKYPEVSKLSEKYPQGTEYPYEVESTDKPHDPSKYPGGLKPIESEKYPFSTQYPEEIASTIKPDEFGKYPGLRPGDKPEASEKYPHGTEFPEEEGGSTVRPHHPVQYPGSHKPADKPQDVSGKYPEGFTGKPADFEEVPYGTEYPEGTKVTGTPQDHSEHPEGSKPIRGPEGVHYPSHTGSTGRPHYSTKYPSDKYPEGFTGKPTGSEDLPYGTEYPEGTGVTGRPQDHSKYPVGTKPQKHPYGTEYPDEVGSTITPDEFGKYPEGTSPVQRPEGVHYPSHTGSTGRPHYSTKHPEGFTGKPIGSEDLPYGTDYPEGTGVTGRPQDHSEYPEGSKPIRGPEGVHYPSHTGSTGRPHYSTKHPGDKYPEGFTGKPTDLEEVPFGTEYPEGTGVTGRPQDHSKYPIRTKPQKHPNGTEYPDEVGSTITPDEFDKYPEGTSPVKRPEGVHYPGHTGSTGRPHYSTKYPSDKYPEGFTGKPTGSEDLPYGTEYPEGTGGTGKPQDHSEYPVGTKPQKHPYGTEYPDEVGSTVTPDEFGKYPEGTGPGTDSGEKYSDGFKPSTSKDRPYETQRPDLIGSSVVSGVSSSTPSPGSSAQYPGSVYLPQFPQNFESDGSKRTERPQGKPLDGITDKPFSSADDKNKLPLELPEDSESDKPGMTTTFASSSPKYSESDVQTDKVGIPVLDHSEQEMFLTTHSAEGYPKRPDSADLTHDPEFTSQFGESTSKYPSDTSPTHRPASAYHPVHGSTTKKPTDEDGNFEPQGAKVPEHELSATSPGSETHTQTTTFEVYTPKQGTSETKRPVQDNEQLNAGSPVKHPEDKHHTTTRPNDKDGSTSPDSMSNFSGSSDGYSTTEYSNQNAVTEKLGESHTKRPEGTLESVSDSDDLYPTKEQTRRPGQEDVFKQPSKGKPESTTGILSPGSEDFDGNKQTQENVTPSFYETTTPGTDDLINKLQSIISGIQPQVIGDKTTRQPSATDYNVPVSSFGHSTVVPHKEDPADGKGTTPSSHSHPSSTDDFGKPQHRPHDHDKLPDDSVEYSTDKPYLTEDKKRPTDDSYHTKPSVSKHPSSYTTAKPLGGATNDFTTGFGEVTTEDFLEEENEIHDPESHFAGKPATGHSTKKPSDGLSTKYPGENLTGKPIDKFSTKPQDLQGTKYPGGDLFTGTESSPHVTTPSDETLGSQNTKYPEGYTDHTASKPHDATVQTHGGTSDSTDKYPEEIKGTDDLIHFPVGEPGVDQESVPSKSTSESSTPHTEDPDGHTESHKPSSTSLSSSTTIHDYEKPESFDTSTKQPGVYYVTGPTTSPTETGHHVHETSSIPKDDSSGTTNTLDTSYETSTVTSDEPVKGVSKPVEGVEKHPPSRPDDKTSPFDEENTTDKTQEIYHGTEVMAGKPTDQPESMIGEGHTRLPGGDSGEKRKPELEFQKPLKYTEKPSQSAVTGEDEKAQVTESEMTLLHTVTSQDIGNKRPSQQEPTEKPLHVVYPTYYPDGIITHKPGSRPQDSGNKVTVTPQANYGTSTPSKGDDVPHTTTDAGIMKASSKVPSIFDGSSTSSGVAVTEGLDFEGSTKDSAPLEGLTVGEVTDKPHASVSKHPETIPQSVDGTQVNGESGTTPPVVIIEEVHTEVHSERATTKPGTVSYDQTTKYVPSVYPHGSDENLTKKPEISDQDKQATKNPDLFSHGTESEFQEGKPGYKPSTEKSESVQHLPTNKPEVSLHQTSQPQHGSSVPVSDLSKIPEPGKSTPYPDGWTGSTTDQILHQTTGKPFVTDYHTKRPESLDEMSSNKPGSVIDDTTPSVEQTGQPGSQHIMNLYSPKDKYSTTKVSDLVKGTPTQQPGSYITGSRVPTDTQTHSTKIEENANLYTTSKPEDSNQGSTFDHEIFGSKFPGRKTTQKPFVRPEVQPELTTVFDKGTTPDKSTPDQTHNPLEKVTVTPTQGINFEHHRPSFVFSQKQPEEGVTKGSEYEQGVTSTEGYVTQGKPLTTAEEPGVIFEGKQTTPLYQFSPSFGTQSYPDLEKSTKTPFYPTEKGASYVPFKIINGRKVYFPEKEVAHKPDENGDFDGYDYVPYEIINGTKVFKPDEVASQPVPTSTTPKHRLGMYVPYKIVNGSKVYYTEDQGKPPTGVEDYDGLDYVPFDIINGTKVFYPESVNEPTQETTTTPSYLMAMYVPYKVINGTKVYYPEDSPNKPQTEDYDGLDYVPFEIVNGKKVFYPERMSTPPRGSTTPSYVMAMYVPYKIINGTKVYYPEDPEGKPHSGTEGYDGLDYVPFEIVNGTKVFYPERVTGTPFETTTKPTQVMAMYVPYKIVNGTKIYYPEDPKEKPQMGAQGYDGLDYVPFEIVNGTKVFYPERATTTSYETTTTPLYPSAMYVPYKIVDGRKVYYPKHAQHKPHRIPEGYDGLDYIPYEVVNGTKFFYPDRATTLQPSSSSSPHYQGMYVPYKIVNGTKIFYPKDAQEKPQNVPDGYDGSEFIPYEFVNGTQVFYPERVTSTTETPGIKAMYLPYKIVDGTKVYYAKDAQPTPNLIPKGYDGFDFVPYEIVNGTKSFYPDRVTTEAPDQTYYMEGMYVPFKIVDGRKVYYPQKAQYNPHNIPEGYEGLDYIPYEIVNGTKVFHPERVTSSAKPTHAPSGTFYPQGMFVPFRVINGTKVFYPQHAQHKPDPMKNDYDGWQHLPYDLVNGTKVFYPERVTTETPFGQMSAMYIPFRIINGTKVFYASDAQYQPHLIPDIYDGFEYVPYEVINGTKVFYPDRATTPSPVHFATSKPVRQGMFVPYKIINGTKVYYPKYASETPRPPSNEYNGVDYVPYDVINGTKVFYPDRIQSRPEQETSEAQAMYVPYKLINGSKVYYPKDAQFKPFLIPEGYEGFDYLPYEMKNGTKVFYPERLAVTQRPAQVPSQGMFVPYKLINGKKVYYPKEAQKRPHPLSHEYDGLDYIPYEIINGTRVFYPEYVTQSSDMTETPMTQAMYVPYKIINGTKVFYPKYAQHKPHLVPDGYDGFEYVPYKIVNGTKFFYPDRVATQPQKLQGMYVPYKIINGTKVFYPKFAQSILQQLPKGFDGIDYVPYETVNGTKVFYPEKATPSGISGTPVVQALYVPYRIINGKKVFYPKHAQERPQTIPEGYDGFAYIPYSNVNGTKMFYPEQAQFPGLSKVPSLQGTFVPYKLFNSTKVFYPKYSNDESPRVPEGYDGVDYVPYESVNSTKVFYPELISPVATSGTSPVPGKYVPYKVVNGKKVFYPKEGTPFYPSGGVRYPYDGIIYVPYKTLSETSPSGPENYPPFITPDHSLHGTNSEIVYVDDDDESFRPQFISQSRPSQEQTGGHIGHVPGEGSCFLNNRTYENNMEIPPVSPCQSRCRCINSIVRCVRIKCPPPPQTNTANCSPVYEEGSCCPTYACENDEMDYLATTEYPGSQDSSEFPEMVLTGSSSTVISFGQGSDSTTQFAVTDASPPKKPFYGHDGTGDFSGEKPHPSRVTAKPATADGHLPTDEYHVHRPQKPKPSEQGSLESYGGGVEGHPMSGEFSPDEDYDGEDEEPYGPGTCRYAGKVYVSAQQIPRDDPCDFCFCFRSDIICLQQSCPPPIPGCRDEPIQGFCCPRYECHVKMATLLNVTSTTTTTTTTLPPHFFLHPYKGSATRTGCFVQGKAYRVGQAIPSASGPCMDCICRGNGRMECEPKVCTPEPMIRKMIVPAENTTSPSSER